MNELLKNYTQEEIENLAVKQLESEKATVYRIQKIDKDYKKHHAKAVGRALYNGVIIVALAGIVVQTGTDLAKFNTGDIVKSLNGMTHYLSQLPYSERLVQSFQNFSREGSKIIQGIGLGGLILLSRTTSFIRNIVRDTRISKHLKHSRDLMNAQLEQSVLKPNWMEQIMNQVHVMNLRVNTWAVQKKGKACHLIKQVKQKKEQSTSSKRK